MSKFSKAELKQRAFERIARVLKEFYDEQAEAFQAKGDVGVHSRLFDTLILDDYVFIGTSEEATKPGNMRYREHVVPCAYIRTYAFKMYQERSTENDVAGMIVNLFENSTHYT